MWSKLHASIFYVSKCSILNKIKVNVKQHIREEIFFTKKKKKKRRDLYTKCFKVFDEDVMFESFCS